MNTLFTHLTGLLKNTMGRVVLGAALAGTGAVSTAHAHGPLSDLQLSIDLHSGRAEVEHRHWVGPVYEEHQSSVWIEPTYTTVPGGRVWVEPTYRTVTERVWHEPITQNQAVRVFVPETFQDREEKRGHHIRHERICIPAHYETQVQSVVLTPGCYENVTRQELVCEGHYQTLSQQVLTTPGHYETRIERTCVREGHWEERPLIRIRP